MNYKKGFLRIGLVISIGEAAFWTSIAIYGFWIDHTASTVPYTAYTIADNSQYNDWHSFAHGLALYGVAPIAAYWTLYWCLSWVFSGFKDRECK